MAAPAETGAEVAPRTPCKRTRSSSDAEETSAGASPEAGSSSSSSQGADLPFGTELEDDMDFVSKFASLEVSAGAASFENNVRLPEHAVDTRLMPTYDLADEDLGKGDSESEEEEEVTTAAALGGEEPFVSTSEYVANLVQDVQDFPCDPYAADEAPPSSEPTPAAAAVAATGDNRSSSTKERVFRDEAERAAQKIVGEQGAPTAAAADQRLREIGTILHKIDGCLVVQAIEHNSRAIDLQTLLTERDGKVIGVVADVFGNIHEPLYLVVPYAAPKGTLNPTSRCPAWSPYSCPLSF